MNLVSLCFLGLGFITHGQITLSNNVGNVPIDTGMFSCEEDETWMKVFDLSEFGIDTNEEFVITSGEIGLVESNPGATLQYRIYSIDNDFPNYPFSIYPPTLLGTRGIGTAPTINGTPQIVQTNFDEPIIVPAGVEKILVTVEKYASVSDPESALVIIAGTAQDNGVSYYYGCDESFGITPTTELPNPQPDANFFINVTGEVFNEFSTGATTRLSHNTCGDIVKTSIFSCSASFLYWSRAFTLADFGISTNEEFVINSGRVAINNTGWLPEINFSIYAIDENFPASFSEADLIGRSQYQRLNPSIGNHPQIIEVVFDTPIIVPPNVERILVEVHKGVVSGDALAFIGGTTIVNDVSWQRGCIINATPVNGFVTATDMGYPDANFYINVTGNVNHVSNNFGMSISNICSEFLKEFSIDNSTNISSVIWDFGDPASGLDNSSTDLSPFHDFSADGTYTITATVTALNGNVEILTETIDVVEPPNAYGIANITACEDSPNSGISSTFDLSHVEAQVLGGQTDKVVTYVDGSGNEYDVLPNPFTNTVNGIETITVTVAHDDNQCCVSETSFDLIVNPQPTIVSIDDLTNCDANSDGIATFDISHIPIEVINGQSNIIVTLFNSNNIEIPASDYTNFENIVANQDSIIAVATNTITNCSTQVDINLIVNANPIANPVQPLFGCDDNNDGISEYFDTSNIENQVLGSQSGLSVSYFDQNGNQLPSPLPNPYTNTTTFNESITIRVTNSINCFEETTLVLETVTQPSINQPNNLYACDIGDGFALFDTSTLEEQIIGNQSGLNIQYFDSNNNPLPSPLPADFQNTTPFSQTILVRVEDASNPICFSETSFDVVVNRLPEISLNEEYFICNLEPSINLDVATGFDRYEWVFEDGTLVSNTSDAELIDEGNYSLTVYENQNGIECDNTFQFRLIRSILPQIQVVNFGELGSNFIEIIAVGDGNFEYSIDGLNFQNSNYFPNVQGGIYTVFVRDKFGCGNDSQQVVVVDYPKFFTPNNDGNHDYWQIKGIQNLPNAITSIFDRYGKLLLQISSHSPGWNGQYNGKPMNSDDYWFVTDLGDGRIVSGHFALKR
ncbi:T9SS type B sorting domain-containing protein [Winogradskyella sp.]|uniref:T9SS type B sorting domain-containing protein n=1 Tax=Winogradskyella sp. TaxID=1883156 RepID=UPI0025CD7DF8|nr:T9SS type B sorting domain-containing protein [Winogradskyella sp.]